MPLTLVAERTSGRRVPYLGDRFRIIHSVLLREPGGEHVAVYQGREWYTPDTLQLKRMEFIGPLHITLVAKQGGSLHFGSVEKCNVEDGNLVIDDRLVARLEEEGWCIDHDERCFGQVVFRSSFHS